MAVLWQQGKSDTHLKDSITARCDGRVWAVDVGMSRYYGGEVQVLEIVNDEVVSVISR